MAIVRQELAEFGHKIAEAGLSAGAGGNISARDGRLIWIKPSGLAMSELKGTDMCCIDIDSGKQVDGKLRPSSELPMHLAIYRMRADVTAIFHTHSPWASGAISAMDVDFKPMFAEVINDLGNVSKVPYIMTSTQELADSVAEAAKVSDTIFMSNHGVVCLGRSMRQAYFRCCVVEDAAKSWIAASIVGKPAYLTEEQIQALKKLEAGQHRTRMAER